MELLFQLIIAHLAGDFFLQKTSWVKHKERKKWASPYLYFHVAIHGVLIFLLTANPDLWPQISFIVITHLLIDGIKIQFQKKETKRSWFFIDQFLHLMVLFGVWIYTQKIVFEISWLQDYNVLVLLTASLLLLQPASYFIKTIISKWSPEPTVVDPTTNTPDKPIDSLEEAGTWIGMIERSLILIFILLNQWAGIGFLLAAKSIFRFGDLSASKYRKLTEYVMLGTFLSFFIAILTGLAARYLLF